MLELDNLINIHEVGSAAAEPALVDIGRTQARQPQVMRLKQAVAQGTYTIDSDAVAAALITRLQAVRSTA
jgi:anti-sigma28 factor (negative regulator of flagellin synthesis)